jgi:hypothetical protein
LAYNEVVKSDRSPSGLPSDRILRQVYGPREIDVDRHVATQPDGLQRVRRVLFVTSVLVAALVMAVVIAGETDAASGIAMIWLAPLVFFLAIVQLIVSLTRPRQPHSGSGGD